MDFPKGGGSDFGYIQVTCQRCGRDFTLPWRSHFQMFLEGVFL